MLLLTLWLPMEVIQAFLWHRPNMPNPELGTSELTDDAGHKGHCLDCTELVHQFNNS